MWVTSVLFWRGLSTASLTYPSTVWLLAMSVRRVHKSSVARKVHAILEKFHDTWIWCGYPSLGATSWKRSGISTEGRNILSIHQNIQPFHEVFQLMVFFPSFIMVWRKYVFNRNEISNYKLNLYSCCQPTVWYSLAILGSKGEVRLPLRPVMTRGKQWQTVLQSYNIQ